MNLEHISYTFITSLVKEFAGYRMGLVRHTIKDTKIARIAEVELVVRTGRVSCIELVACGSPLVKRIATIAAVAHSVVELFRLV